MTPPLKPLLVCSLAGLLAAAGAYVAIPPIYQSQAKLLVRYVVARSPVDRVDDTVVLSERSKKTEGVIATELDIVTSGKVMARTMEAIGPKRILSGAGDSAVDATRVLRQGLKVSAPKGRNMIGLSFESADPELPSLVLERLIIDYFSRHLEIHRSTGAYDFLVLTRDQGRAQMMEIEERLRTLKAQQGNASDPESKAGMEMELMKLDQKLRAQRTRASEDDKLIEQARLDEALDPFKIPNISVVQRPSQPVKITRTRDKAVIAVAATGVSLGVVLSLLSAWRLPRIA